MAQKDGIIRNLEHKLEERNREIERLRESLTEVPDIARVAESERVRELEKRMMDLESLVKGITEELLDLKTIVMKLYQRSEAQRTPKPTQPPTVVIPTPQATGDAATKNIGIVLEKTEVTVPKTKGEEEKAEDSVLIMQPDGTLKPEQRQPEEMIIASNAYGGRESRSVSTKGEIIIGKREGSRSRAMNRPLINAEEEEKE